MKNCSYQVVGEVFPLPAPSESAICADMLSRLNRRLTEQMRTGRSIDWRIAAMEANDQVRSLRKGEKPLTSFRPAA